ncbi:alpha/beta hydrolase family esterase [Amycolatopsis pigmentata]|uniref:Alpha/beta hydrolase family esterase n=1 Tax=Amycolatopsis pigmentata TaxID=450801 RepID=A0ABW5G2F9_9PSEU
MVRSPSGRKGRFAALWAVLVSLVVLGIAACSPGTSPSVPPAVVTQASRAAVSGGAPSTERDLTVGGIRRTYLAIGAAGKPGRPLLIVLHGRGYTARQESIRTGFLPYAERGLADLVYPQGTANSWNAGHGCCGRASAANVDDVGFVTGVADDAIRYFGSDPKRVYLVGYSNGARLTFEEMCRHPALFAGFATYGALPPAMCEGPPKPVLIAAGAADTLVRGEGSFTGTVAQWRSRDGCPSADSVTHSGPLTLTTWAGCHDGTAVASALYHGIGHPWPAVKAGEVPFTAGVGAQAAAATVMWNFLTAHPA